MMRIKTGVVKLCLTFFFCGIFFIVKTANSGEPPPPAVDQIPSDLAWHKVDLSERIAILEFLMNQTRGNYERICTWQSSYLIHHVYYDPTANVQAEFGSRLPKDSSPGLIRDLERTLAVTIDNESGSVFRQCETTRFRQLTTDSRKPIVIPGVRPVDNRSILTSADYKYFDPKEPPATNVVVANHPMGRNKRYARRVPAEKARNQEYGDLLDPRDFYRCGSNQKSWDEMQLYLSALKGEKGPEQKQKAELLEIAQSDKDSNKWYRLTLPITSRDGSKLTTFTSVWSPLAGFNPVCLTVAERDNEGEAITKAKSWKWKKINGIFVPTEFHEVWHPKGTPDDVDTLNLTVKQKKCVLNAPVPKDQFDYAALGLKSGDLILDDIEQTAYIMDDSGQPKRLAAYNEKYVPEPIRARRWNLRLVIGSISAVLAIALAVISLIRVVKRRRRSHGST